MSPLVQVMFLVHGLSGLELLRLHLLMLFCLVVVPFLVEVLFLAGVVLLFGLSGFVVARFGKHVVMMLMFSCVVTPQLLPCLI